MKLLQRLLVCICLLVCCSAHGQIITTVAGSGSVLGDGGFASAALIDNPTGIAFNKSGELFIATGAGHRIRKIDTFGIITTVAGTGVAGYSGDNGLATAAQINFASDIAIDSSDNIYFSDASNFTVRKIVSSTGIITTICGNGISAYSGDNGFATAAQLNNPNGICLDKFGNIYISDNDMHVVRKINALGIISRVAGTGVSGYNGDGIVATTAKLYFPVGLASDEIGNIYIADQGNARIRKINPSGIISTYGGNGSTTYVGDGIPATTAQFSPNLLKFDRENNLYFTAAPSRVFKIANSGLIYRVTGTGVSINSGDGGQASEASVKRPFGLAFDGCNNLYLSTIGASGDSDKIRKVHFNPECWPLAVDDAHQNKPLTIYPNPATGTLHIDNLKAPATYTLYDVTGRVVATSQLTTGQNEINTTHLSPGIYLLHLQHKDGTREVHKIVKE